MWCVHSGRTTRARDCVYTARTGLCCSMQHMDSSEYYLPWCVHSGHTTTIRECLYTIRTGLPCIMRHTDSVHTSSHTSGHNFDSDHDDSDHDDSEHDDSDHDDSVTDSVTGVMSLEDEENLREMAPTPDVKMNSNY